LSARDFQTSHPGLEADVMLAETLQRARHTDEAVAVLSKSLSDRPNRIILMQLVRMALESNDRKRAGDLMSKWLANRPTDAAVRMEYAAFLLRQDDAARATAQYQIVLKQNPNNIDALNNLGWLIQRTDPKRALSLLTRAWQLSPNSANVAD